MEANNNNHKVDSLKRLMAEYGWWKDNEDLRKLVRNHFINKTKN